MPNQMDSQIFGIKKKKETNLNNQGKTVQWSWGKPNTKLKAKNILTPNGAYGQCYIGWFQGQAGIQS